MSEGLETKYYNFELIEYLKGCSLKDLECFVRNLKSNELNKTSLKILGSIYCVLENYDKYSKENDEIKQIA